MLHAAATVNSRGTVEGKMEFPKCEWMNVHKNARPTLHGRERIVSKIASGHTPNAASEAVGVWRARLQSSNKGAKVCATFVYRLRR